MTCFLPRANDITQYQIAGYALFGHFGASLGARIEVGLQKAWGDGWYDRVFPGAPPKPREDHFDPEAVLRALIGREVPMPPTAGDRTELRQLIFPLLTERDLRELRALRGSYAHYEGSLATVGEVRERLRRTLALLGAVAKASWKDSDLEQQVFLLESRVADLEASVAIGPDKAEAAPLTQYEQQLQLAVQERQRAAAEREAKRVSRSALRLGDPYEGPEGGRELRLLRSADELWDVKERIPASSAFDASSVQEAARGMRNFLIDPQLFLDEDDLSLSTSLARHAQIRGQTPVGPRTGRGGHRSR